MVKKTGARTVHLGPPCSIGVEFSYIPQPSDILQRVRMVWPEVEMSELVCAPPYTDAAASFQKSSGRYVMLVWPHPEYFDRRRHRFSEYVEIPESVGTGADEWGFSDSP